MQLNHATILSNSLEPATNSAHTSICSSQEIRSLFHCNFKEAYISLYSQPFPIASSATATNSGQCSSQQIHCGSQKHGSYSICNSIMPSYNSVQLLLEASQKLGSLLANTQPTYESLLAPTPSCQPRIRLCFIPLDLHHATQAKAELGSWLNLQLHCSCQENLDSLLHQANKAKQNSDCCFICNSIILARNSDHCSICNSIIPAKNSDHCSICNSKNSDHCSICNSVIPANNSDHLLHLQLNHSINKLAYCCLAPSAGK